MSRTTRPFSSRFSLSPIKHSLRESSVEKIRGTARGWIRQGRSAIAINAVGESTLALKRNDDHHSLGLKNFAFLLDSKKSIFIVIFIFFMLSFIA
jgi:hypothetical protein